VPDDWQVIGREDWTSLRDGRSELANPVAFAADVTPERTWAAIAAAGRRPDGLGHVEIVAHHRGTGWVVGRMLELADTWQPCAVVVDGAGPAGSLIAPMQAAGLEVIVPSARDAAQACGAFYDAAVNDQLRHLDQAMLNAAVAGAKQRPLGDAWAWARKGLSSDISPLVAVTLAAWGHATRGHIKPPEGPTPMVAWG
jgi:hypothetical protein